MPELDDATSSNEVETWIDAVFKACQLQWQEPAKEYKREEQEDLKADNAKAAKQNINLLRQKSKSTYSKRSEIEAKPSSTGPCQGSSGCSIRHLSL